MDLQAGDRLLTRRESAGSAALRWWLNSEWSHVVPVLDAGGEILSVTWPKAEGAHISEVTFDRAILLRPLVPFRADDWQRAGRQLAGWPYDLRSYLGFLVNKEIEDRRAINCAEACLLMDHAAGLLQGRSLSLISPQSYAEFADAGLFEVHEYK